VIVVDTSALIAIVKREPMARVCSEILLAEPHVMISAGTLVEAHIVAMRGGRDDALDEILASSIHEVIPVTEERTRMISDAYRQWGKTFHPAALNFGDCFSYATAREFACPLLYIGNDFAGTDLQSAIAR
jgi:ribonuclease VapC